MAPVVRSGMTNLHVVIASTRPGRVGLPIGRWFFEHATALGKLNVTLIDLKEVDLPMYDEPNHPREMKYQHEHTKRWSATISQADAFAFVTPEYNFSTAPALVNALHYLYNEWCYKPVGFVSYGGISGGLRAVQMTKLQVTALKMMPIPDAVTLPFAAKQIENGVFKPTESNEKAANAMLAELEKWATALKTIRARPTSN